MSPTLSAEQEQPTRPAAATEEPAQQLSSLPTNQILSEPPLRVQTSASTLPASEIFQAPAPTAQAAQEETAALPVQVFPLLSLGDTDTHEVSVSVLSTPTPVQAAPPLPLSSGVSAVSAEVDQLPASTFLLEVILCAFTNI